MRKLLVISVLILLFTGCDTSDSNLSDSDSSSKLEDNQSKKDNLPKSDETNEIISDDIVETKNDEVVNSQNDYVDIVDKNQEVSDANNSVPPSIPEKYLDNNGSAQVQISQTEDNATTTVQRDIFSLFSNEITFGTEPLAKTVNFSGGDFGEITYSENISDDIFNISLQFDEVEQFKTSIILRIEEIGSSRLLIVVFPKLEILTNGEVDSSNMTEIHLYGIKSSGVPLVSTFKIDSKIIYSKNQRIYINLVNALSQISNAPTMNSYLNAGTSLKFQIAFTNLDNLADGQELSTQLSANLKGDLKSSVDNKIINGKTFGVFGKISIQ